MQSPPAASEPTESASHEVLDADVEDALDTIEYAHAETGRQAWSDLLQEVHHLMARLKRTKRGVHVDEVSLDLFKLVKPHRFELNPKYTREGVLYGYIRGPGFNAYSREVAMCIASGLYGLVDWGMEGASEFFYDAIVAKRPLWLFIVMIDAAKAFFSAKQGGLMSMVCKGSARSCFYMGEPYCDAVLAALVLYGGVTWAELRDALYADVKKRADAKRESRRSFAHAFDGTVDVFMTMAGRVRPNIVKMIDAELVLPKLQRMLRKSLGIRYQSVFSPLGAITPSIVEKRKQDPTYKFPSDGLDTWKEPKWTVSDLDSDSGSDDDDAGRLIGPEVCHFAAGPRMEGGSDDDGDDGEEEGGEEEPTDAESVNTCDGEEEEEEGDDDDDSFVVSDHVSESGEEEESDDTDGEGEGDDDASPAAKRQRV